ncbi:hypothetical protein SRHO_G00149650 [Serrasalmus rhombeus]
MVEWTGGLARLGPDSGGQGALGERTSCGGQMGAVWLCTWTGCHALHASHANQGLHIPESLGVARDFLLSTPLLEEILVS